MDAITQRSLMLDMGTPASGVAQDGIMHSVS